MPRKSVLDTAKKVFEAIPVVKTTSIAELSRDADVSWVTARAWLETMIYIQNLPEIQEVQTSQGVEYTRQRLTGKSKKIEEKE